MLVAEISDSEQYVFKTTLEKVKIASEMCNSGPLAEEFCYFDGNEKHTHNLTSLTANAYHPFLRKQIPLATMECKAEDSRHVAQFWKLFNNCYKEANETENKFEPTGWCTNMAATNMNGLRDVYGYDVIPKVKGCEFHYSQSVEKHSKTFQEHDINMFKVLANKPLTSETREAYNAAFDDISKFILKQQDLPLTWLQSQKFQVVVAQILKKMEVMCFASISFF